MTGNFVPNAIDLSTTSKPRSPRPPTSSIAPSSAANGMVLNRALVPNTIVSGSSSSACQSKLTLTAEFSRATSSMSVLALSPCTLIRTGTRAKSVHLSITRHNTLWQLATTTSAVCDKFGSGEADFVLTDGPGPAPTPTPEPRPDPWGDMGQGLRD